MAAGELAAAFRSLARDAAETADRVAGKIADWAGRTATNVKLGADEATAADARAQARLETAGTPGARLGRTGGVDDDSLLSRDSAGLGRKLPMSMTMVTDVAEKYGIDISDVRIRINKSVMGYYGSTAEDQTVTLTRSAFNNEEQLARTLAHERHHVDQLRSGMGYPDGYDATNRWETAAKTYENDWWEKIGKGLR